jgi:hypothetical protein
MTIQQLLSFKQIDPNSLQCVDSPIRVSRGITVVQCLEEIFDELRVTILFYCLTSLTHQIQLILHVVNGEEMCAS